MPETDTIEFDFEVVRIQTMADGSPRVIIGLPERNMPEAFLLAQGKIEGKYYSATVTEHQFTGYSGEIGE